MTGLRPTQAEIKIDALRANFALARRLADGRDVIAVVKADAYGHGAALVARTLVEAGCEYLAVVTVEEAAELRAAGLRVSILVLGGIHNFVEACELAKIGAIVVVHRKEQVGLLSRAAAKENTRLQCQIEVDSGMSRMGLPLPDVVDCATTISYAEGLTLQGAYTHFSRADEVDLGPSKQQVTGFGQVIHELRSRGIDLPQIHIANSAGLLSDLSLPEWITAVRPGLMLYGVCPAAHLQTVAEMRPVMTLRTQIALIRSIEEGTPVGYSATYRAPSPRRIATLPIGYADGVPVAIGRNRCVLHRGLRVPVVGRVSMDFITIDLGDADAEVGDQVTIFGPGLPVEEVAEAVGTIPYELLIRVGRRVPRRPV